jgi:hypothetical protein
MKKREILRGMKILRADKTEVTFMRWGAGAGGVTAWVEMPNGKLATLSATEVLGAFPDAEIPKGA